MCSVMQRIFFSVLKSLAKSLESTQQNRWWPQLEISHDWVSHFWLEVNMPKWLFVIIKFNSFFFALNFGQSVTIQKKFSACRCEIKPSFTHYKIDGGTNENNSYKQ